jgi:protein-S-isoprenylcysteine O-methyltransferase Ste14
MKIKRGWQLFAAVIEVAIMAAVAVFGAVMIAVPVPILLHFLSKYGVTGTPATMICRLAGVLLLIAGLWTTRYCWQLLRASFRG